MARERSGVEKAQSGFGLVAMVLGVVPLVRMALGGEMGSLLSWVPGTDDSPGRWLVPAALLVVSVAAIAVLERRKA